MKKDNQFSRYSLLPPVSGEAYTRFFSSTYDLLTSLSGWRQNIAAHALEDLKSPASLLDVGCGTGYLIHLACKKGFQAQGVDPSTGMIQEALERYNFPQETILEGDATQLPFSDASFDIVTASGSLVYVRELEKAVLEISRVLKKGGQLRIIDHSLPREKVWYTPFITLFSHISGDILHDYQAYFEKKFTLMEQKTLGRGGYLQRFDFKKNS